MSLERDYGRKRFKGYVVVALEPPSEALTPLAHKGSRSRFDRSGAGITEPKVGISGLQRYYGSRK